MNSALATNLPPDKGCPSLVLWPRLTLFAFAGIVWLFRGRWRFSRLSVREIQAQNLAVSRFRSGADLDPSDIRTIAWVGYVLPRIARRVPWRADCLVQALAAQEWLSGHDVASVIVIGVERPDDKEFGAHAWLTCGETVVTGGVAEGETARYSVILGGGP